MAAPFHSVLSLFGITAVLAMSDIAAQEQPPATGHHHAAASSPEGAVASTQDPGRTLMDLASGTSMNPISGGMHAKHLMAGDWTLMLHGKAVVMDIQQSGSRGEDQIASANWGMIMATRAAGKGAILLRSMLSLEPATIRQGFYPMLFQTGEEAAGEPIVDGQHPHDFFMELAFSYARPLTRNSLFLLYLAPVGDPALGPVAFPHRITSEEIPAAVLGHHLQDATHILYDVVTAGWDIARFRVEASAFHGAEPDEHRWDLESGPLDSYSARVSWRPEPDWVAQISRGRLNDPEAHDPQEITRSTASVLWFHPREDGYLTAGAIWGRNDLAADRRRLNSYLLEAGWKFHDRNHLFGRMERLDRDELFAGDPTQEAIFAAQGMEAFTINAFTVGYTRDLFARSGCIVGAGGDATFYAFPSELEPFYGSSPEAFHLFLRIRYPGSEGPGAAPTKDASP